MSREALSLEISRVVSRVVSGEPIDMAERGARLAEKYPDLGMSGEMIGEAISRAAGMVGMIKSSPMPAKRSRNKEPAPSVPVLPVATFPVVQPVDATLVAEADGESGGPASGESDSLGRAHEPPRFAPIRALRRAFFRH